MTKTPEKLTKDWKEGKLKAGSYYVQYADGEIEIERASEWFKSGDISCGINFDDPVYVYKVLAPVPTYNEYKAMQDQIVELTKKVKKLEEENVENLGYIGGLLNEGNEQVIKNRELRDLLRECKRHVYFQKKINNEVITLLTRINAALGESEE